MKINEENFEISTQQTKIVISKEGIDNFKEVIDDIEKGKHLFISSFNYYMKEEINEKLIENIKYIHDLRIVFNTYNKKKLPKIIEKAIEVNPYIQIYYCENNHSKIISTGSKMYVGSANYTGYSMQNLEMGVIIDDSKAIKEIEKRIFYCIFLYKPIIHDPIQPLIILLIQIIYFEKNNLSMIESLFNNCKNLKYMHEEDFDNIDYDSIKKFYGIYKKIMNNIKKYIINNRDCFYEDGAPLQNFIDRIDNKLLEIVNQPLGFATYSFGGFYEDYTHCLEKFKEDMLIEEFVEHEIEIKAHENLIFSKYKTLLNMLLYFRNSWIREYKNNNFKFEVCDKKCIYYFQFPNELIDISIRMLNNN